MLAAARPWLQGGLGKSPQAPRYKRSGLFFISLVWFEGTSRTRTTTAGADLLHAVEYSHQPCAMLKTRIAVDKAGEFQRGPLGT